MDKTEQYIGILCTVKPIFDKAGLSGIVAEEVCMMKPVLGHGFQAWLLATDGLGLGRCCLEHQVLRDTLLSRIRRRGRRGVGAP